MSHPLPQALCDRARLLSGVHSMTTVAEILGAHHASLYRARKRGWRAAFYETKLRPIPTDFAIIARTRTNRELMTHYRAGPRAVARWLKQKPRPRFKPGKVRQQHENSGRAKGWEPVL